MAVICNLRGVTVWKVIFPLTRKLILNDSPYDLTQHCERAQPSLNQSTTELSASSIMHSTSATASSLILHFQTRLSALAEPSLCACQSNSLAFVRPAASTEAWLCCSRLKPVTENDWLVWRGRGSHLHVNIFGITDWSSAKPICNTREGREYLGAKRKGVGKEPRSRACSLQGIDLPHTFLLFYSGTVDKSTVISVN